MAGVERAFRHCPKDGERGCNPIDLGPPGNAGLAMHVATLWQGVRDALRRIAAFAPRLP